MSLANFKNNPVLTMGVELELQLIDLHNFNLTMEAADFLRRMQSVPHTGEIKPEITQSMIELNSSVHTNFSSLLVELKNLHRVVAHEAAQTHIGVCGGGSHPFQKWSEQRIFPTERFNAVSEQYGYLAKQFTVFGQHIHIACANGDDALYLCHALARYIPHFIALAAASPFHQGIDTSFDCSRLAVISAFPLSGTPPWCLTWTEFAEYYQKMFNLGVVKSMKDFYWDIRPKPEFGTVEIRIGDTPLTVTKAAHLAAYAQMLAAWLLDERPNLSAAVYLTYFINRFRAARFGLEAVLVDPVAEQHVVLAEDILQTCNNLQTYAQSLTSIPALEQIQQAAEQRGNDAKWLRALYQSGYSLTDVVRAQTTCWQQDAVSAG